jgi:[ribosomal protein S18]-alanine N-acetyltransferase
MSSTNAPPSARTLKPTSAPSPARLPVQIRWSSHCSILDMCQINQLSFPSRLQWSLSDFQSAQQDRATVPKIAETADGKIVGYIVWRLLRRRIAICSIAVHPLYRRQGVGSQMMQSAWQSLQKGHRDSIVAEVSDGLLDGHLFLRSMGFVAVGVERGYYGGSMGNDMYRFVLQRNWEIGGADNRTTNQGGDQ